MLSKKVVPGSTSRLTIVDHNETYGRHILDKCIKSMDVAKCVDIGCGTGSDLLVVSRCHPKAELTGIDLGSWNADSLQRNRINYLSINIENDKLPFDDKSIDLIIANQVLEHTKEIFWINHEIFRTLKIGGYLFLGIPNLLSFHNRVLMVLGDHPTQHKLTSAHVRPFSKRDVFRFYHDVANLFCKVEGFWGSQFYPFPKAIARALSAVFPSLAFSIFFLIKKTGDYNNEFVEWPEKAQLETNYYTGK